MSELDEALRQTKLARRHLGRAVRMYETAELGRLPDPWREDLLKTLDDVEVKVRLARELARTN